jgi:N-acetylglucosaminyl-diphospho-decaprenol L-rhamnosyltransferase
MTDEGEQQLSGIFPHPAGSASHLLPKEKEEPGLQQTTAILVTYNSYTVIAGALQSLPAGMPAIVVDNASTDDSAAIAEGLGAAVIRRVSNAGFGVANNEGWTASSTPYVLFLNPDARLLPGALERLLAAAETHPTAGLLVPTIRKADGSLFEKHATALCAPAYKRVKTGDDKLRAIAFASGAVVLARRETLVKLGGFDPEIFLYFEDDDLSRRVLDLGQTILHVVDAEASHAGNTSSPPSLAMTQMKHWHMAWSQSYVARKHRLATGDLWRIVESTVKLLWAKLTSNGPEQAKQRGRLNGTRASMRGLRAQDLREKAGDT